jgi:hypothetical protein
VETTLQGGVASQEFLAGTTLLEVISGFGVEFGRIRPAGLAQRPETLQRLFTS